MKLPIPLAPAGLMLLCFLLGAELVYETLAPPPEFRLPKADVNPRPEAPMTQRPFVAPPPQAFSEIDERSLFSPSRQAVQGLDSDASAGPGPSDMVLVGIIMGPGNRIAVLKTPGAPVAQNVSVGGTVNGWRVTRIEADHIVLRANSSDQEVKLQIHSNNSGAGTQAQPSLAPGQDQPAPAPDSQ